VPIFSAHDEQLWRVDFSDLVDGTQLFRANAEPELTAVSACVFRTNSV